MIKTIKTGKFGKVELSLVNKDGTLHGRAAGTPKLIIIVAEAGETADQLWMRLHDEVGKASPAFFGYDGARTRFLRYFPGGFNSEAFVGTGSKTGTGERAYKLAAKSNLESIITPEVAATGFGFGEAVIKAFVNTNMLEPRFELPRVGQIMRSATGDAFIQGAARFTLGDVEGGLAQMATAAKPHDGAKWTLVTYLPFLWRPEIHAFLKPRVTKDYAERVGHPFANIYEPALRPEVYASLLDLYAKTRESIADLNPRDNIDVQSFIWVVDKYTDENVAA